MRTATRRIASVVLAAGIATTVVWWKTETVVPEWIVVVRTSEEQPIPGVPVLEAWQHQTMESDSHTEVRVTDSHGTVTFPKRQIRASIMRRIVGGARAVLNSSYEVAFGPYAQVIIGVEGATRGCDLLSYMPRVSGRREDPLTSICIVTGAFTIKRL